MTMIQLYGTNKQGIQEYLGEIDEDLVLTERQKFAQIAREYYGGDPDNEMSDAGMAMGMFDNLEEWRKVRDAKLAELKAGKKTDDASSINAELLDALERIRDHTNVDDPESYRCDDREGCFDTVFSIASDALAKAKGGAS